MDRGEKGKDIERKRSIDVCTRNELMQFIKNCGPNFLLKADLNPGLFSQRKLCLGTTAERSLIDGNLLKSNLFSV